MSEAEARAMAVAQWMSRADRALAAADRELEAGDCELATNRIYYACFYAASALLLSQGLTFTKHAGVRAAVHQQLVRSGRLSVELGEFYDRAFDDRNEADYQLGEASDPADVRGQLALARQFVGEIKRLNR